MYSKMTHRRSTQRGFGLLEVVLASGVLAMVVGAAVGLVRSSLRRTVIGLERTVAMNLAQEPIEQLRSARDSVHIDGRVNTWTDGWGAAGNPSSCIEGTIDSAEQATCPLYRITPPTGSSGWQILRSEAEVLVVDGQTFRREVYLTVPVGFAKAVGLPPSTATDAELARRIHVIVRWDNNRQAVEAATVLTNWRSGI